jgi:hypothetical protein
VRGGRHLELVVGHGGRGLPQRLAHARVGLEGLQRKNPQGWLRLWANFRPLIGISSQTAGSICGFWANPVNLRFALEGWAAASGPSGQAGCL